MKITFGKYKNQELSKIYEDDNYKNWLLKQVFFKNKYPEMHNFLINYKPLSSINFTDLPCDIKLMIYSINYKSDPNKLFYESRIAQGYIRHCKKGWKKITLDDNQSSGARIQYQNCGECGNLLLQGSGFYDGSAYEYCGRCYDIFRINNVKRRKYQEQLQNKLKTECLLDTDSSDED